MLWKRGSTCSCIHSSVMFFKITRLLMVNSAGSSSGSRLLILLIGTARSLGSDFEESTNISREINEAMDL
ncbi:hypothetical protein PVK06_010576 [Gossypium arboreum]|uniref:Uncharacterized protein n=1 Tax=Gossypium arboreum TaxID=29729 RepID=A0ABR0Q6M3_GOSAR|nr:hypothetical protein PVK06_010576 [Gossypium arboreum]